MHKNGSMNNYNFKIWLKGMLECSNGRKREQKCKKSTQTDLFLSYVYMKLNILFHISFILFRLLNHSTNTMIRFNKHRQVSDPYINLYLT